jgi:hypothetical protein
MNAGLEDYLGQVERNLRPLDPLRRGELLLELRHHLEDSVAYPFRKSGDEDDRIQSAIAHMGPPDEIGRALVGADRPRSRRRALLAILPYALLPLAGFLDFITAHNHSFITVVLLLCFGASFYFWSISRRAGWPAWLASWAGIASMLPIAITESGSTTGGAGLFALSFLVPLVLLNFFRKQSLRHTLLALGAIIWVGIVIVLRVSYFRVELAVMGVVPIMTIVYFLRQYAISRSPMQPVQ